MQMGKSDLGHKMKAIIKRRVLHILCLVRKEPLSDFFLKIAYLMWQGRVYLQMKSIRILTIC